MEHTPLTVLVVEDEPTLSELIAHTLKGADDLKVTMALSGKEALVCAAQATPDVVLLDLIMPEMDGFEVLEKLRADDRMKETAIVVFSNLSQDVDRRRADQLGADSYYVKSDVDITRLKDLVRNEYQKKVKSGVGK